MKKLGLAFLITVVFFVVLYLVGILVIWIAETFGPGAVFGLGMFLLFFTFIYYLVLDE